MGFIKNALLGIAIYEGIKYWLKINAASKAEAEHITLGGKQFIKTENHPSVPAPHHHHLDRPEITTE